MTYRSLDDVGAAYYAIEQETKRNLFAEGNVIMSAIDQGFAIDETVKHCSMIADCSARTVYRRYAVQRTFKTPHPVKSWECHAICADLVDYRSNDAALIADQQEQAQRWLVKAVAEGLSTRQLRQALHGARVTDRIVLLDCAQAIIGNITTYTNGKTELTLWLDKCHIEAGSSQAVQVTMVMEVPKEESEAACYSITPS